MVFFFFILSLEEMRYPPVLNKIKKKKKCASRAPGLNGDLSLTGGGSGGDVKGVERIETQCVDDGV